MKLRPGRPNESSTILVARAAPSVATPARAGRLEGGEKLLHALEAALESLFRGRIRDPDMLAAAKRLAGTLTTWASCSSRWATSPAEFIAATTEKMRDVGISVESASGRVQVMPGIAVSRGYDAVTQANVFGAHLLDALLRPLRASIAAFCTIDAGFEVCWPCNLLIAATMGAGASA